MNIYEIIKRVKISCCYTSDAELARALNMSPQNFLSQKKTGKIKDSLMVHAIERGVNIEWIKTGVGNMHTGNDNTHSVREQQQAYGSTSSRPPTPTPTSDLLVKTAQVLESESIYRTALKSNIEAFHHALISDGEMKQMHDRLDNIDTEMKSMQDRLKRQEEELSSKELYPKSG